MWRTLWTVARRIKEAVEWYYIVLGFLSLIGVLPLIVAPFVGAPRDVLALYVVAALAYLLIVFVVFKPEIQHLILSINNELSTLRAENTQLRERLTPKVEIILGDDPRRPEFVDTQHTGGQTIRRLRIGVKNVSDSTITRAHCKLVDVDPIASPPVPVPMALHLMHDNPGSREQGFLQEFTLDPHETKYVDVVVSADGETGHRIAHAVRGLGTASLVENPLWKLTVLVHGQDMPSVTRTLWLSRDNTGRAHLRFAPGG